MKAEDSLAREDWNGDRLQRVLDRLPEAILVLNQDLYLEYANGYALDILKKDLAEAVGESLWTLLPHLKQTPAWTEFPRALADQTEARFTYLSSLTGRWLESRAFFPKRAASSST